MDIEVYNEEFTKGPLTTTFDDEESFSTDEILYIAIVIMFGVSIVLGAALYFPSTSHPRSFIIHRREHKQAEESKGLGWSKVDRAQIDARRKMSLAADQYIAQSGRRGSRRPSLGTNVVISTLTKTPSKSNVRRESRDSSVTELYMINEEYDECGLDE
ncbi:hypothetical protein CAPTEDRAFT_185313 [Capitella teleta]|uniref:Uncharacterized protein n=1 Tax=Capitella teleta TaxID=283909 RepID=R7VE11_CAPTE|nr:hypothetical protein CAPTEDRAFT_185313 [Capitella teleta]|eukprot:ELU13915.1 hypothetical protein CAPTEDRAFT_185313 [Capitella teleta]